MATVHQFPAQGKPGQTTAHTLAAGLRGAVDAAVGPEASFAEREAAALTIANEVTRLFLQGDLEALRDAHGEQVEVDGAIYKRHEPGTVRYYTLGGTIDLERWTYRAVGVHNGPTVVPLDLEAGLVEGTTPALGLRILLGYAKDHMRSAEEDMQADHRCPPSRSTLERVAKAMGTAATQRAPQVTRRVRQAERVPEGAVAIALGLDRTAVPMEEDVDAGTTPRPRRTTPYVRTPPGPVTVNYRMAYVGTVSFHDAEGRELATRHYSAGAHEAPADRLVRPMLADLRHALQQDPTLAVGVVQDGAPELWTLLSEAVVAEPLVTRYYEAIDRYHLTERLADLLTALDIDAPTRTATLRRWNASLDHNDRAIYRIRTWVRARYAEAVAQHDDTRVARLAPHLTYLENNAWLMRYARLRAVGLPVGSGVTEGACKSVIKMRTNGGGQRWRPRGLTAVLTLRALYRSERLPRFWANFAAHYRKEVVRLCA